MKPVSSNLAAHLSGEVTTLATCWKLTLRNGTVMGFTDHSRDITVDSVLYEAASGFSPTAVRTSSDLAVDNMDVEGMFDSAHITEADMLAGIYDFAEVEIFKVNYVDISQGTLPLRRGYLGEVSHRTHRFVAEIRGLTQHLSQHIGEFYSPACRANLGDSRCKFSLASVTHSATVSSVTDNQQFTAASLTQDDGFFTFGKITFTSGNNNGLSMEVKEYTTGNIILVFPLPYAVTAGDGFDIEAGCDKTFETCVNRFNNAVNFRGEPHVPGTDKLFETAGTFR